MYPATVSDPDATNAVHEPIHLGSTLGLGAGDKLRDWALGPVIGRGGSSVVFEATRVDGAFTQRAAVKLLRTVLADEGFQARFARERRILLQLGHPYIVQLLDGGHTDDGVPWYAMQRIDGVPLTEWSRGRPLRERLSVVVAVARAVDYAHQRLVVHCDLKPDNVLVDAEGEPHVLDFGIARLVDEDERTGTLRLATPRWASPEQLEGGALTTATDVYALGLLLWSVLTDAQPRDEVTTGRAMLAAALEPLPPPSRLEPGARGDLDAIVFRATAPEPGERYRSAGDFADDVERHLRGEAVRAREGVAWYRASRWARRNKGLVAGLAVAGTLLVGWMATTTVQSRQIRQERDRAEATLDLLVGMLEAADPAEARGEELTVREVLDRGVRELELQERPAAVAGPVRLAAGRVQAAVGAAEAARRSLWQAHAELTDAFGPDAPLTLRAERLGIHQDFVAHVDREGTVRRMEGLVGRLEAAGMEEEMGLALLDLAEQRLDLRDFDGTLSAAQRARGLLRDHDPLLSARSLAIHGYTRVMQEQRGEGVAEMRQALDETVAALGTRVHPDVADILHELALSTYPRDFSLFEESIELRRQLYGDGFRLAAALCNYGLVLDTDGQTERAIEVIEQALAMAREAYDQNHPDVLRIEQNLAAVMVGVPEHKEEALRIFRRLEGRPELPEDTRQRVEKRLRDHWGPTSSPRAP